VFGFGNLFNFVGLMLAAQSLLEALGSVQFVSNLFFARLVNGEPVTPRAIVATVIIMIGNCLIIFGGNKSSETYNLEQLGELFLRPTFLVYFSSMVVLIIVLQIVYLALKYWYLPNAKEVHPAVVKYMPVAYAGISAMIGTWGVSGSKALSGLFFQAVNPEDGAEGELFSIWTILIAAMFLGTTIFWLYRMNLALGMYDALFIIPVLQTFWLLFAVVNGGIYFEEFESLEPLDLGLFALGIIILLCGVAVFTPRTPDDPEKTLSVQADDIIALDGMDTVALVTTKDERDFDEASEDSLSFL